MGIHKYEEVDQSPDADDSSRPSCSSNHDTIAQLRSERQQMKSLRRQNTIQWTLIGIISLVAIGALHVILQDQSIKIPNLVYCE